MKLKHMSWIYIGCLLMIVFWRFALIAIVALGLMLVLTGGVDFFKKLGRAVSAFQADDNKPIESEKDQ